VVELIEQRLKRTAEVGEIHDPPRIGPNRPTDMNLDPKGMAVKARALVSFGDIGEPVGGLDLENTEYVHARIVPSAMGRRKLSGILRVLSRSGIRYARVSRRRRACWPSGRSGIKNPASSRIPARTGCAA